jgi:DNA repair exonuclease SbcCD ATPase subunit
MTPGSRDLEISPPWLAAALALALGLSAVAGCSSEHLTLEQREQADLQAYETQIRKVVRDPTRADQLIGLTTEFQQLAQDSIVSIKHYRTKLVALNSNYEATRADYEAVFSEQDAARDAFFKKATALRQRMAALTSDSEWEEFKKARLRGLEADLQELLS